MIKYLKVQLLFIVSLLLGGCNIQERIIIDTTKSHYKLGITQYVYHESLDAASLGFKDEVSRLLNKSNKTCEFIEVNSQGETALCTVSAASLVSHGVDLILANATPSFQAAINTTKTIPIVGNSITSYETAIGKDIYKDLIGTNATGTSDLPPLDKQASMIFDLLPDAKNIGLFYCSCEPNSLFQINGIEEELNKLIKTRSLKDISIKRYPFLDSNEIEQVARKAAIDNDVLYVPIDNTCASNALSIKAATYNNFKKIPVICGDINICKRTGIASLAVDYYSLGQISGAMAADILLGNEHVEDMKIRYAIDFAYQYNEEMCEKLGIEIDERFDNYQKIG